MSKLRLFLSFIPDQLILQQFNSVQAQLIELLKDKNIKWDSHGQFHLTLRFLGDIEEEKVEPLISTLDRLKFDFETIEFETDKIDFFPNKRFPNVIYAGLKETGKPPHLTDTLVGFIDKIIHNFGVKTDKKFIPHITFGRFNKNRRSRIEANFDFKLPKIKIIFDSYSLMQSQLLPGGSEYKEISKFNFSK